MNVWTPERRSIALQSVQRWQGTPHHNRIRQRGVGVDCIQFVYAILNECGVLPDYQFSGYDVQAGMWGESTALQETMLVCLHAEWVEDRFTFGDIFISKTGKRSAHCGFYTNDGYIWHALANRFVTRSDFVLWRHDIKGMIRLTADGLKRRSFH